MLIKTRFKINDYILQFSRREVEAHTEQGISKYHNNGTGGTCHSDGETFLSQHLLINVGEEGVEVMGGGAGERHVTRPLLIKTLMGFN